MRRFLVLLVLSLSVPAILASSLHAKAKPSNSLIVGTWKCIAHGGENGQLPFTLYLQPAGEGLTGTISAPQGEADLTSVMYKNNHLKIAIDTEEHKYSLTGKLYQGQLKGEWYRDGQKKGNWEGKK